MISIERDYPEITVRENGLSRKVLLYVEETQNDFINALLERDDLRLVLLRFSNCMNFSEQHLRQTQSISSFIWNKNIDFDSELKRLRMFLSGNEIIPDFFYNDSEFNQILAQKIARTLKLPGALSERQAELVRNKIKMKCFIKNIGLRCPHFSPVNSLDEAKSFAARIGYPIIVKWHSGVSSIDVFKVASELELDVLPVDLRDGRYMVEEFRQETIWCIDALTVCGQVQDVFYTWLPYTNLDFAANKRRFTQMSVGQKQENWNFNPYQLTQTIVSGLGVGSGYLHLEVFITEQGEPLICEFAWRTPGDHMISNLSKLYGTDIPSRIVDSFFGVCHKPLPTVGLCVGDVFFPMKDGTVTEISDIQTLRTQLPILAGEVLYSIGDRMESKRKYTDNAGWIQVSASSIAEMLKTIDCIYSSFVLKVTEHE